MDCHTDGSAMYAGFLVHSRRGLGAGPAQADSPSSSHCAVASDDTATKAAAAAATATTMVKRSAIVRVQ